MNNENVNMSGTPNAVQMAASFGLVLGIYLSAMFLVFVGGESSAMLSLLALLMLACVPVMVLRMMRATYLSSPKVNDYLRLWSMGVMIFGFASLICALVTFVWMQFVHPGFIYDKAQEAVNVYRTMPEMQNADMVNVLQKAIDNGDLPTPIQFVMEMIWITLMLGSVVSAPLALLARLGKPKSNQ